MMNLQNSRRLYKLRRRLSSGNLVNYIMFIFIIALIPPFCFHLSLTRFRKMQMKDCNWLHNPPLVCAHGGDSKKAFANTEAAYRSALRARADCIEIDVSRSSDDVLFALHDRDLQEKTGNHSSRVGFMSMKDLNELKVAALRLPGIRDNQKVLSLEDALRFISNRVERVILDVKVGPPSYGKGLAQNVIATVRSANCLNCVLWAKNDTLVREIMRLYPNSMVGYIVLEDPKTRAISDPLRMKRAEVVGVAHQLIDEKLVQTLYGRNKTIYAWTVDNEISMRNMLSKNVDAIITSNPALLQQVMKDTRKKCVEDFSSR